METEITRCPRCGYEWEAAEVADYMECPRCYGVKVKGKTKPLDDPRLKEVLSNVRGSTQTNKDKK